jgi:hypothetical protein
MCNQWHVTTEVIAASFAAIVAPSRVHYLTIIIQFHTLNATPQQSIIKKYRDKLLDRRRRGLIHRKFVVDAAKKVKTCPHCGVLNGAIKKAVTAFKLMHVIDFKTKDAVARRAHADRHTFEREFASAIRCVGCIVT